MSNHIFCNLYIMIDLPIVHLEHQSNKVRQNRSRASLSPYWWRFLSLGHSNDGESEVVRKGLGQFKIFLRDDVGPY
jgi:hypothetical protein